MILAPRYLPRLVATVGLFTRYGLLDFARRQGLLGLEGINVGKDSADAAASPEKAKEFRERLIELGPAYIKLGQVLSTRPDLLPPAYIKELESLQDSVPPMPLDQVERTAVSGHFHADPHPGNIFVVLKSEDNPRTPAELKAADRRIEEREAQTPLLKTEVLAMREAKSPADPADPKLAMVDFGMTSHLTKKMRDSIVRMLLAMADNRGDEAAEVLIEMGEPIETFDRNKYVREISALIAQYADQTVSDTPAGLVLYEMISIGYRTGLRLPSDLTLLAKALFNLDAVTRALDPAFNPSETIREYAGEIANQRARQELSPHRLFEIASSTSDLLQALPRRLDTITERISRDDSRSGSMHRSFPHCYREWKRSRTEFSSGSSLPVC